MKLTLYLIMIILLTTSAIATEYTRSIPEETVTNERFEIIHHFSDLDPNKGEMITIQENFPPNIKLLDWHIVGSKTRDTFQYSLQNTINQNTIHGWDIQVTNTFLTVSISVVAITNGLAPVKSIVTYPPNNVKTETTNLRVITVIGEQVTAGAPACFDGKFKYQECWDANLAYTHKCEQGIWVQTGEECELPECSEDKILDCGNNLFIVEQRCEDNFYQSKNNLECPVIELRTNKDVVRTAMLGALLLLLIGLFVYNRGVHKGEDSTPKTDEPEKPTD